MIHRIQAVLAGLVTLSLVILLGRWWSNSLPPLGRLFSPQEGFWQNADPVDLNFSGRVSLPGLSDSAFVWFDDRLVPHLFATNEKDLYFLEGYVTAEFRLWQMELQVRAAAGRVSEILGPAALNFDRLQRRKGMVTAAEAALEELDQDSLSKMVTDAYTAGVNAWIGSLDYRKLPLEYKLLGYRPEPWSPLKCALLTKYMSDMLTGDVNSIENTNALRILSSQDFWKIYPDFPAGLDPIVPEGTRFDPPRAIAKAPPGPAPIAQAGPAGIYFEDRHDPDNGSNNWAVDGRKTRSGAPILCNDPHLDLNLPSLWYEIQLSCGNMNVYGVSLPGAPGVIIGFNDSIAFGETNAERDVKDYFAIRFRDASRRQYRWKNGWKQTELRAEKIRIRGQQSFTDTVAYTVFGPVTYDPGFPSPASPGQSLASHWVGMDPSDEGKCIYLLDHATGYPGFLEALSYFQSPGQNFAYADKAGHIAIWEQGKFPLLWRGQGKFVMPGQDSSWDWQGYIPYGENPHVVNPADGFVSSANQQPTDSTYPYYYSGDFKGYRGGRINQVLRSLHNITIDDMEKLQTDVYNSFAAASLPFLLSHLQTGGLEAGEKIWLDSLRGWDLFNEPYETGPSLFQLWWDSLYADLWSGYLPQAASRVPLPDDRISLGLMQADSGLHFLSPIPPRIRGLRAMDQDAFHKAMAAATRAGDRRLQWGIFQGTNIMHLTKLAAFSYEGLYTGGGEHIVNATKRTHGPSWRMIVQMSDPVRAVGIFPGGENGNPGSRFYGNMIRDWVAGRYYPLHFMKGNHPDDPDIQYRVQYYR